MSEFRFGIEGAKTFLEIESDPAVSDPRARLQARMVRSSPFFGTRDVTRAVHVVAEGRAEAEKLGDLRMAAASSANVGFFMAELGAFAQAESALRDAVVRAERLGSENTVALALHNLAWVLTVLGRADEGVIAGERAVAWYAKHKIARLEGATRLHLVDAHLARRQIALAEEQALLAMDLLRPFLRLFCDAHALLASTRFAQGRLAEAIALTRQGCARDVHAPGTHAGVGVRNYAVLVEMLEANGDRDEARETVVRGVAILLDRVTSFADVNYRRSFLGVAAHVYLRARAREWGVDTSALDSFAR